MAPETVALAYAGGNILTVTGTSSSIIMCGCLGGGFVIICLGIAGALWNYGWPLKGNFLPIAHV